MKTVNEQRFPETVGNVRTHGNGGRHCVRAREYWKLRPLLSWISVPSVTMRCRVRRAACALPLTALIMSRCEQGCLAFS